MKSEKFWNSAAIIGVITAYLYSISVLTQYGQNLFFNTHQSLIETSIMEYKEIGKINK